MCYKHDSKLRDSFSGQSMSQVLAWSLAPACHHSSFGSAFLVLVDICTWSSFQPWGIVLLASSCFMDLSAQALPGHSLFPHLMGRRLLSPSSSVVKVLHQAGPHRVKMLPMCLIPNLQWRWHLPASNSFFMWEPSGKWCLWILLVNSLKYEMF